jgi:acetyl-CoA carboxylase alpha subunit
MLLVRQTFTKRQGAYVGNQNEPRGRSAVVARTVRACEESVRVPSFSRDLLPKTTGLTRETV